jgi:hexosaminidase
MTKYCKKENLLFIYFKYIISMKNIIACFLLISFGYKAPAQQIAFSKQQLQGKINGVIPEPVSLKINKGSFLLRKNTKLLINTNNAEAINVVSQFSKKIEQATGYVLSSRKESNKHDNAGTIRFNIVKSISLGNEGYRLNSNTDEITIEANTAAGLYYGMQTLIQLLPKEIESKTKVENINLIIPSVEIEDYPAFTWRGMMLDVSRHFFTKQQVEEFIDEIVKYKFNVLHLHLTDDQ